MNYILDYCIASLLYLGVIVWFYLRQKQVPNLRSQIFKVMLLVGFVSVFLDIATVLMEQNATFYPIIFLWLVNFSLLFVMQLSPLLFLAYTLVITGKWNREAHTKIIIVLLPAFVSAVLLFLSTFGRFGAFYIDDNHIYHKGAVHMLLYVVAATYILLSTIILFRSRKDITKKKQRVIYAFVFITGIAMLLQYLNPQYLLNSTANALSLLMIYCALELPSDHLDPLTGAFNRSAAAILLEDLYLRHQPFCIQIVSLKSFKLVNQQFGNKIGDIIFREIYDYLRTNFSECKIFRCYGDVFSVIRTNETMDENALLQAAERFPKIWDIGDSHICIHVKMACINSVQCLNAAAVFATLDYIIEEFHHPESKNVLLADHEFYNRRMEKSRIEHILEQTIANNSVEVYYQPIHRSSHEVESLEALLRVYDEELGFVPTDLFSEIAEQNGSIIKLGEQVLRKVCQFMQNNDLCAKGISSISINLSAVQCMQENLSNKFLEIVLRHKIDPHRICFEITETASVDSFEVVRKTMDELSQKGFHFSLDDFGTGYANFRYISELPFSNVKIDKALLWSAIDHPKQRKLLLNIVNIIRNMDLRVICEGVETEEQIALLNDIGVDLHQGFYYSKALPEADLLSYLRQLHK